MKLEPEPREIDLCVRHGNLTKNEAKELGKFIEELRRKDKAKNAKQCKAGHPDLKKLRPVLFWDTSIEKIDWNRQKNAIIKRVFERGNHKEKEEIRRFYGNIAVIACLKLNEK